MNLQAIHHVPMSEYAHGVSESRVVFRLRAAKGDLKSCTLYYGDRACRVNPVIFTSETMKIVAYDSLFDWWEVEFDTLYRRICYYFEINDGNQAILYYADFFSGKTVPDRSEYFQLPYVHRADVASVPDWARDAVIYNIFPDSFATSRRYISLQADEKEWCGKVTRSRLGGTIKGITENADYLKGLGVNCVYINPIFTAGEYHKYDLLDYYSIDPCFGTNDDFREMVNVLHQNGIRIIIDVVFNHCGWRFFAFEDVVKNGENSRYKDWFYRLEYPVVRPDNTEDIPGYECFAYERLMPKINTANPEAAKYFTDVARFWLKEYQIDGLRFDVANEMDDGFLRMLRKAAEELNPDSLLIGEVWESAGHWLDGSMFHSAMNYDFRKHCRDFFAREEINAAEFNARVTNMLMRYRRNIVNAQLNLLDSHDASRFLSLCGGDKEKMKLAVLFQMCFVGIPGVLYGDEQGITGVTEEGYRHHMIWDGDSDLYHFYQKAIAFRHKHISLRRGSFKTVRADGDIFVFERTFENETVTVALNTPKWDGSVLWSGDNFVITGETQWQPSRM